MKIHILVISLIFVVVTAMAGDKPKLPGNSKCLQCHGKNYYSFQNENTSKEVHKRMSPYFIINKTRYQNGVHKTFECTDCHLPEYETYPHEAKLKLEPKYICQDCHSGDENFAKFNFEGIEAAVQQSVHGKIMGEDFTCEMCHNPHYYSLEARSNKKVKQIVQESNQMCLKCHEYTENRFYLLSDSTSMVNEKSHPWLPNQQLHFNNVRCLDCHGGQDTSMLVSHNILGKDKALKTCVECHSDNSVLMSSLYKHDVSEKRNKLGFFNGVMMNESFVIGANRNFYLNAISIIIFSLTLLAIAIHIFFRIIFKK